MTNDTVLIQTLVLLRPAHIFHWVTQKHGIEDVFGTLSFPSLTPYLPQKRSKQQRKTIARCLSIFLSKIFNIRILGIDIHHSLQHLLCVSFAHLLTFDHPNSLECITTRPWMTGWVLPFESSFFSYNLSYNRPMREEFRRLTTVYHRPAVKGNTEHAVNEIVNSSL